MTTKNLTEERIIAQARKRGTVVATGMFQARAAGRKGEWHVSKSDEVFRHPSYGMVQFSRVTGGHMHLFGSSLEAHHHRIELRISEAEWLVDHDLHMERPHPTRQIIEVALSAAQFAELVTSMNVSMGVPCTITRREGKGIERPPEMPVESVNVRTDFAAKMAALRPNLKARAQKVLDALPAGMNKKTRREIEIALGNLVEQVAENGAVALDQFQEATERVTAAAKAEVDAVVTHAVVTTGLDALAKMKARGETPVLPAHEDS